MKKLKLFICSTLLVTSSLSFGQSWKWGEGGYRPLKTNDFGGPVATDKNGDAYVTGQFQTTVTFGGYILNCNTYSEYLTKYDSTGNVVWAKQINDSTGESYGTSIATDNKGNIFIAGYFTGTAKADNYTLNNPNTSGNADFFIIKYNSSRNVQWAKQSEIPVVINSENVTSIAADKFGNSFITGYFQDSISFGSTTLYTPLNTLDVFLVKYDSTGNVIWANQSVSHTNFAYGYSVTTDNMGYIYITGSFSDSIMFGALSLNSPMSVSAFLVKYSSEGIPIWARQSFNSSMYCVADGFSVITDREGNPYITGYFGDSVSFGTQILYSSYSLSNMFNPVSAYLAKYDGNGNFIWAEESSPGWGGFALASDEKNSIYLGGIIISGTGNPDSLVFNGYKLYSNPSATYDAFLVEFDTSGNPLCGSILDNLGYSFGGVASDSSGSHVYVGGTYEGGAVTCGPDVLTYNVGGGNNFLGSWQKCRNPEGINTIADATAGVILFPNPNKGLFTLELVGTSARMNRSDGQNFVSNNIEVYNILGEKVFTKLLPGSMDKYSLDLGSQPAGIYLYRIVTENGQLMGDGKFVIE